jgi:hypothetical protein
MVDFYQHSDITLGPASRSSGHEAYLSAIYNPPETGIAPFNIIYKKNKYGCPTFSRFEVGFSQLSRLFLLHNFTPCLRLVVDKDSNITGLAVQHLRYLIEKREGLQKNFYRFDEPRSSCAYTAVKAADATEIPYYFLDKLPQGFYARLVQAEVDGHLTIDYESLASILSTSMTLEEDDLHKGNYGFYLIEKDGKPQAVFFKIDHDLMYVDSIMGFHTRRPFHLFHGAHAFDIKTEDLISLASLKHSSNSYWPTKFSYFSNPFDNKEYHSYADIEAFARLDTNPQFNKAKWKSFLKHILMSSELIEQTLKECADARKATERANITLISQATTARLARLRAALFSIKEFRDYVSSLNEDERLDLLNEVLPAHLNKDQFAPQVQYSLSQYHDLCKVGFEAGDTPLHTAIKLGQYRYEETLAMFGEFINVKNTAGKTPLDIALERVDYPEGDVQDMQKDARYIIKHLLINGAEKTAAYQESGIGPTIKKYRFKNPYLEGINATMHYQHFKAVLRDIGEDHRLCLKSKKNLALECVKRFIRVNQNHPHFESRLLRLRNDLNGESSEEEGAGVKYIRQLRSKLWIIRQLRGLYGMSSTLWEMNELIDTALEQHSNKREPNCFSFFSNNEYPTNECDLRPESTLFMRR